MRLVTYGSAKQPRLGVVQGEQVVDVAAAIGSVPKGKISDKKLATAAKTVRKLGRPPADMIELLAQGERYIKALGVVVAGASGLGKKAPKGLMTSLSKARLLAPIAHPQKITCVGLNYADHAKEGGVEPPKAPVYFLKSHNTICGPGDAIKLPPNSEKVDYEAEFAVVIGKRGRDIAEGDAQKYIAGYTILHDVSARDMQFSDNQWYRGKSCDTFAPFGPWIVTPMRFPTRTICGFR